MQKLVRSRATIADPACGAGDLLLAAAWLLPLSSSIARTLRLWGRVLQGRDINATFVRTCRLRLALLASERHGRSWRGTEGQLAELLPRICVGDGLGMDFTEEATLILLNPPFGAVVTHEEWGQGRLGRAAVFTASLLGRLPADAVVRAILPDVLRSGTNYRHWREHVESLMAVEHVEAVGRFDTWTDVDVFFLRGRVGVSGSAAAWWPHAEPSSDRVGDSFEVRVGPVVPHRDPKKGTSAPYLRARDLPLRGTYRAGDVRLRHEGRRFDPPFVAVRRTSRPDQGRTRVVGNLILGTEPVLVENHLLVCIPADRSEVSCRRLLEALEAPTATRWLNQRIRCRHLTVGALREVPYSGT